MRLAFGDDPVIGTRMQAERRSCNASSVVVVARAFRSSASTTALFIGYFDQGVADALPPATAQKIFTTLRPYRR